MSSMPLIHRLVLLGVTVLLLGRGLSADATPVLDQSYVPPGLTTISNPAGQYAQTFTATVSGVLTEVDIVLALVRDPLATFDLRPVLHGVPVADTAQVLASLPIPLIPAIGLTQHLTAFDLTAFALVVHPGDVLAFTISGVQAFRLGDAVLAHNPDYPGGALYSRSALAPTAPFVAFGPDIDIKFQTFVDPALLPAAVPEPASVVLLLTGLLGLVGSGWQRRVRSRA